jgi:hypothetical protein
MMLASSSSRAAVQVRRAAGRAVAPFRAQRVQQRMETRRYAKTAEVEAEAKPGARRAARPRAPDRPRGRAGSLPRDCAAAEETFADEDDDFNPSTQQVRSAAGCAAARRAAGCRSRLPQRARQRHRGLTRGSRLRAAPRPQVQDLLNVLESTEIAEMDLKVRLSPSQPLLAPGMGGACGRPKRRERAGREWVITHRGAPLRPRSRAAAVQQQAAAAAAAVAAARRGGPQLPAPPPAQRPSQGPAAPRSEPARGRPPRARRSAASACRSSAT